MKNYTVYLSVQMVLQKKLGLKIPRGMEIMSTHCWR